MRHEADDVEPQMFQSPKHLLLSLRLRKRENSDRVVFAGRFTMPNDPLSSDRERIAAVASDVYSAVGWRFR
jgi:hypothetical protein